MGASRIVDLSMGTATVEVTGRVRSRRWWSRRVWAIGGAATVVLGIVLASGAADPLKVGGLPVT